MAEPLVVALIVAVVLLVADLVLAGGAMTMTGMSSMVGLAAHPLGAVGLTVAIAVLAILVIGAPG